MEQNRNAVNTGDDQIQDSTDLAVQLSNLIGVAVIVGSFTVKLPVIKNVLNNKSVLGLALGSLYCECLALTCSIMYNFKQGVPASNWAELASVLAQNGILVGLFWKYSKLEFRDIFTVLSCFALMVYAMANMDNVNGENLLWVLPLTSTIIALSGNVPQILTNWNNKHTGALSIVTQGLVVAGGLARLFTTYHLANDMMLFGLSVFSFSFQVVLLSQIYSMRAETDRVLAKLQTKKSD